MIICPQCEFTEGKTHLHPLYKAQNAAQFEGLNINVHLNFSKVGEKVEYKVTVKNGSKKDYEIDDTTKYSEGEHIKYEVSYEDSNIIKKGETSELLRIKNKKSFRVQPIIGRIYFGVQKHPKSWYGV